MDIINWIFCIICYSLQFQVSFADSLLPPLIINVLHILYTICVIVFLNFKTTLSPAIEDDKVGASRYWYACTYSPSRRAFLWEISVFFIVYLHFKVLLYCLFVLPLSTLFKILINILYQPCSQRPFRIPESVFLDSFITWKESVGDLWKTIIWNFNFLRNTCILRKQNLRKISRLYVTKIVSRAKVIALLMQASRASAYSLSLSLSVSLSHTPKHPNTKTHSWPTGIYKVKWQDK